ncbi:hypothetical protein, partial [Halopseudomonas pelagia]|uniref:hypothetical protein n=1 Tax=Halopseudomonas pelagia TaxID=553151 RepID=UPI0030DC486A
PSGYEPDELPDCSTPRLWAPFYSLRDICQAIERKRIFISWICFGGRFWSRKGALGAGRLIDVKIT